MELKNTGLIHIQRLFKPSVFLLHHLEIGFVRVAHAACVFGELILEHT